MGRVQVNVVYDASEEIDKIILKAQEFNNVDISKESFIKEVQTMFTVAFEEGRKYERNEKNKERKI
jgi:hypothetical protein